MLTGNGKRRSELADFASQVFALIERHAGTRDSADIITDFLAVMSGFGFTVAACGAVVRDGRKKREKLYFSTWPPEWMKAYVGKGFAEQDLIVLHSLAGTAPFRWRDVYGQATLTPLQSEMWSLCQASGWTDGLAVPIHGPGGYLAITGMGGRIEHLGERDFAAARLASLWVHDRLLAIESRRGKDSEGTPLSWLAPRERECLGLVAAGRTDRQIARVLGLSESTVHFYIERAKTKLGVRSRAHAIALIAASRML